VGTLGGQHLDNPGCLHIPSNVDDGIVGLDGREVGFDGREVGFDVRREVGLGGLRKVFVTKASNRKITIMTYLMTYLIMVLVPDFCFLIHRVERGDFLLRQTFRKSSWTNFSTPSSNLNANFALHILRFVSLLQSHRCQCGWSSYVGDVDTICGEKTVKCLVVLAKNRSV
jgi:hypothetical protein